MEPCPHDLEIVNRGPVVWVNVDYWEEVGVGRMNKWPRAAEDCTVAGERAYTLRCKLCGHELIRVIRIGV